MKKQKMKSWSNGVINRFSLPVLVLLFLVSCKNDNAPISILKQGKEITISGNLPKDVSKIEVRFKETNTFAEISVADNGKGIDDTVKDRIFEPKFTTKSSGMGLGLPMVKNIIEAYGGSIDFVTSINKGTVFTVKLPKE